MSWLTFDLIGIIITNVISANIPPHTIYIRKLTTK